MREHEGARSSRASRTIRPLDRRRLRLLDRAISRLDWAISINKIIRPQLASKQIESRRKHDEQRRWLRLWMKGVIG